MDSLTVSCGTAGPYKPSFKTFKFDLFIYFFLIFFNFSKLLI